MAKTIKWVDQLDLAGKRVFCRVDFNVPLDGDRNVADDTRIRKALPTLKHILAAGGKLICASHLGRPRGQVREELRMEPVGARLAELLGGDYQVVAPDDCVGDAVKKVVADMAPGDVVLLENLRFHAGEKENQADFARALARLGDVYVNDAFGTSHRAHASMVGVPSYLPIKGGGFLLKKEVAFFGKLLHAPEHPFVAVLGGAKVSGKLGVILNLLSKVQLLLIGGAMANTFIKARGGEVGRSRVEEDLLEKARTIMARAETRGVELLLPVDALCAESLEATVATTAPAGAVPDRLMALDIGPRTRRLFAEKLAAARTVFWNGPMGVFENPVFAEGTMEVARAVADSEAVSVVGGGDSVSAVNRSGLADRISHISTGGGASLELVEGKKLPGLQALEVS